MRPFRLNDSQFEDAVRTATSYRQLSGLVGHRHFTYTTLKRRIDKLGLSTEHFVRQVQKTEPIEKILTYGSARRYSSRLRKIVLEAGLLVYECALCGLGPMWQEKALTLELDHINGINNDNRVENLRFLCPNCHTQTDTYGGKKRETEGTTPQSL